MFHAHTPALIARTLHIEEAVFFHILRLWPYTATGFFPDLAARFDIVRLEA
jgi:hypothetical protein